MLFGPRKVGVWRRYYQAGLANAAFGYSLYAGFVAIGSNRFLAQISAHVIGIVFNYFSYSLHVFRDAPPAKLRFVLAYALNYLVGLAAMFAVSQFVRSPYLAGILVLIIASLINYVVLRHGVFRRRPA